MNIVDSIIAFEMGELGVNETLDLFSELIRTGQAWQLQGSYGRMAQTLIDNGMIDREGNISVDIDDIGGDA